MSSCLMTWRRSKIENTVPMAQTEKMENTVAMAQTERMMRWVCRLNRLSRLQVLMTLKLPEHSSNHVVACERFHGVASPLLARGCQVKSWLLNADARSTARTGRRIARRPFHIAKAMLNMHLQQRGGGVINP